MEFSVLLPNKCKVSLEMIKNSESARNELGVFYNRGERVCICLCQDTDELKLSIKRRNNNFYLAAFPNSGCLHNQGCPHYTPLDTVLTGDLSEGSKKIIQGKVFYSCTVSFTRKQSAERGAGGGEKNEDDGTAEIKDDKNKEKVKKIGLNILLNSLWNDAQLSQWSGGHEEKRNWEIVRSNIIESTKNVFINKKLSLKGGLYVPMAWKKEDSEYINTQKELFFSQWKGKPLKDFLVIGEIKEIEEAEHGYVMRLKNDNTGFYFNQDIYDGMEYYKYPTKIYSENAKSDLICGRVIAIMGCNMPGKYPIVRSLALMGVSNQYIPVLSENERKVVDKLIELNRTFIKPAKIKLEVVDIPDIVLLDTGTSTACGIFDETISEYDDYELLKNENLDNLGVKTWKWFPHRQLEMPDFPEASLSIEED